MDVSHAILFLENADFVRITGLYFPAKFELIIIYLHYWKVNTHHIKADCSIERLSCIRRRFCGW